MKGLLQKDLIMLWHSCKSFLLLMVVFAGACLYFPDNPFYMVYPMILSGVLPVTILSYEERCGWTEYCKILPLSPKMIVGEKYVFAGITTGTALVLLAVVQSISLGMEGCFAWDALLFRVGALLALGLFGSATLLPLMFRFGTEKGRIAYYILLGGGCAASTLLLTQPLSLPSFPGWLLPLGAVILLGGSYALSVRFYQRKT